VLREFGLEQLAAAGELTATCAAHAAYFLALAEEGDVGPWGRPQEQWLKRLEQDQGNVGAALQWLLEAAEQSLDLHRSELALRLGVALGWFWDLRGPWSEGLQVLNRALASSEGVHAAVRAKALDAAGWLASYLDDYDQAQVLGEKSLVLHRELGDAAGT